MVFPSAGKNGEGCWIFVVARFRPVRVPRRVRGTRTGPGSDLLMAADSTRGIQLSAGGLPDRSRLPCPVSNDQLFPLFLDRINNVLSGRDRMGHLSLFGVSRPEKSLASPLFSNLPQVLIATNVDGSVRQRRGAHEDLTRKVSG